jgi:hypothetical protein
VPLVQGMSVCVFREDDGSPCAVDYEHRHCAACHLTMPGEDGQRLCAHHSVVVDEWARGNRAFCNWLHRGVEPPPQEGPSLWEAHYGWGAS